ncbi:tRNA pseudouridine(55) synthase TruB [Candidatus Saccharibacteria bacterium]|nr:tRNA pseudouridine(55) synthase TruB [Candidatus Saccharibacteria bacterium]
MNITDVLPDGILLVDKPAGMTSFGVVARVRRQLGDHLAATTAAGQGTGKRPKVKVGHTGTLDPFATGLMILVVGKECRNAGTFSKLDKVYEATFRLGQTSSTGDPEGEITTVSDAEPTLEAVQLALGRFNGEIQQTPPAYSAIKINGQRAYKLARKGEVVEMPTRTVTIHTLSLLDYTYPEVTVRAHVSSGTYIRTLAEDVGQVLGTGAYCSQLRRTRIAQYDVASAIKI